MVMLGWGKYHSRILDILQTGIDLGVEEGGDTLGMVTELGTRLQNNVAPVRLFQTVLRLALLRIFQQQKFASLAFRIIAYRVSKFCFFVLL